MQGEREHCGIFYNNVARGHEKTQQGVSTAAVKAESQNQNLARGHEKAQQKESFFPVSVFWVGILLPPREPATRCFTAVTQDTQQARRYIIAWTGTSDHGNTSRKNIVRDTAKARHCCCLHWNEPPHTVVSYGA